MATSPPPPPPSTTPNPNGETTVFAPIKLICQRRKKVRKRREFQFDRSIFSPFSQRTKHEMFLNFVDYRTVNSTEETPCLEILDQSAIQFDDCISVEYFDAIKTIYQSFISLYYPSLTISIYFSDEHFPKKEIVVKHLKSIFQSNDDQSEEIFHSFDAKLIPCPPIIPREHPLIGRIRLFFTMTDLYISSIGTSLNELKMTMNNPNSVKEKSIISIPYFTIKHYGNRGRIFLVELGKSKYGDGELRMKCLTSTLASTIHLFASPVIEERPWVLSSAFANQFITDKRREKSKHIHPPIPFHHDVSKGPIIDLSLPFLEKPTEEPTPVPPVKSRSFVHTFRKFVKHVSPLQRSVTLDQVPPSSSARPSLNSLPDPLVFPPPTPINVSIQRTEPEMKLGSYVDMGPATKEINEKIETIEEEKEEEEEKRKVDVGVNTIISISPQVRSVIIVGNSVHLISEGSFVTFSIIFFTSVLITLEKEIYPIGQRSFTSPASVLQPFRSQLRGQVSVNNYGNSHRLLLSLSFGVSSSFSLF